MWFVGRTSPGPHAISIPVISQTCTPPTVRGQGTPAWGLPAGSGPGHVCPSFHPWGGAGPPRLGPAGISMFPAWESCSDVRSLKIEFQMSGFIRGSLKLALLLLTCAHGAGGGGARTASVPERIRCQIGGSWRVPSLIGLDPSGLVSVLCLAPSEDKPLPTGRSVSVVAQVRQAGAAEREMRAQDACSPCPH